MITPRLRDCCAVLIPLDDPVGLLNSDGQESHRNDLPFTCYANLLTVASNEDIICSHVCDHPSALCLSSFDESVFERFDLSDAHGDVRRRADSFIMNIY